MQEKCFGEKDGVVRDVGRTYGLPNAFSSISMSPYSEGCCVFQKWSVKVSALNEGFVMKKEHACAIPWRDYHIDKEMENWRETALT